MSGAWGMGNGAWGMGMKMEMKMGKEQARPHHARLGQGRNGQTEMRLAMVRLLSAFLPTMAVADE